MQNQQQPLNIKMESDQIQLTVAAHFYWSDSRGRMFSPEVVCSFQVNNSFPFSLDVITGDTSKTAGE